MLTDTKGRALLVAVLLAIASVANASPPDKEHFNRVDGLRDSANLIRDEDGVPHIFARNEHDLFFLQGWTHARDRLFQMDVQRRQADGTLAELLGPTALESDVQLRLFGVRRAADRSWPLLSAATRADLQAYAAGVNAFVARNPLPAEYGALELTTFRPWTALDSLAASTLQVFAQNFDLDDIERTDVLLQYQAGGVAQGFDGTALFFEDLLRVAPFNNASTVPDARGTAVTSAALDMQGALLRKRATAPTNGEFLNPRSLEIGAAFLARLKKLPWAQRVVRQNDGTRGSNEFLIAGRLSSTGQPILANDPHFTFPTPAVFYENHLHAPGFDVIGASFPGAPFVVLGHNERITWGATTNALDLTDVYQEQVVADAGSPSGFSTVYQGALEHVVALPQVFRTNVLGDGLTDSLVTVPADDASIPPFVFIVPRRNNGPMLSFDPATGVGLSVQFTLYSGSCELEAFRGFNLARNLSDFRSALAKFDGAALNWTFADVRGDIAYLGAAEVPLREDLDAGAVAGLPPYFIRNGQGGNEWVAAQTVDPDRTLPFEILPVAELPQAINPVSGLLISANNDPVGTTLDNDPLNERRPNGGILYLGTSFDLGIRAGRIKELFAQRLAQRHRLGVRDLQEIQADVVLGDAQFFVPHIVQALRNAQRADAPQALRSLAADPRVQEAVARLGAWDFSTPTGIVEGFDASDRSGQRREPGAEEIANSVAASLFAVWRNQIMRQVIFPPLIRRNLPISSPGFEILTAIQRLFATFDTNAGKGASGIDFFEVPGIAFAQDRRDVIVLRSLAVTLNVLAGPSFATAFNQSTNQNDYRWGRLHRLVLAHPLGDPFGIPPADGAFLAPLAGLRGIPVDGGLFTVDLGEHPVLNGSSDGFMVDGGPARRSVAWIQPFGRGIEAVSSLPGGESGALDSPFHANLLPDWLTNETFPLRQDVTDLLAHVAEVSHFEPGRARGP